MPQIGSKKPAWANSHNFTIVQQPRGADGNKVDGAKVFINWLSQHSLDWAAGGQVPARKQVRDDAEVQGPHRGGRARRRAATTPRSRRRHPASATRRHLFYTAFNEAILGKKPVKQALDDGAAKADKLLEDNRKKYGT